MAVGFCVLGSGDQIPKLGMLEGIIRSIERAALRPKRNSIKAFMITCFCL